MLRRHFLPIVMIPFVFASLGNAQESKKESEAHRQLEKVAYRLGRWESETVAPDGKVLVHTNFEWALGGNAIAGTYVGHGKGGTFAIRMVTTWDAQEKKIKTWAFDSVGRHGVSTYAGKEDGKHMWDMEFLMGESLIPGMKSARLVEDVAGQTFAMTTTDGKPVITWKYWKKASSLRFPFRDQYSPDSFPSNYEHLKPLEHRIGNYVGTIEMHGPKLKGELAMSVNWSLNKNFLEAHYAAENMGEGFGITGWNSETKSIQNWIFMPDGSVGISIETLNSDGTSSSQGTLAGSQISNAGGQNADGTVTVKGMSDGKPSFTMTFDMRD